MNQNIHSVFILISNDLTCSMILTITFQGTPPPKKLNLVPLNPNVMLAVNDELKRPLFPKDDTLLDTVTSKEFQDLLFTDTQKKKVKKILQNILGLQRNGQKLNIWDRKKENFQILHNSTSTYF